MSDRSHDEFEQAISTLVPVVRSEALKPLRALFGRLLEELNEHRQRADAAQSDATACQSEIERLEGQIEELDIDARDAVEKFLERCERPVGTQTFIIKAGKMTDQAILGMMDAVGIKL